MRDVVFPRACTGRGSRTVSIRRATTSPGEPTRTKTNCQGRSAPTTGSVTVPAAVTIPTIQPPMKYASPDPRNVPNDQTLIAMPTRSRGK